MIYPYKDSKRCVFCGKANPDLELVVDGDREYLEVHCQECDAIYHSLTRQTSLGRGEHTEDKHGNIKKDGEE